MSARAGEFVRHLAGSGWAPVSRRAMDDELLSAEARGVLAWLVTRPDDHKIFVRYAQRRLGLSQARWQRIRKELEAGGYLVIKKTRAEDGNFCWNYHLFDDPEAQKPHKTEVSTIGQKFTDGKIIGQKFTDGKPTDNKRHTKQDTSVLDKYLQEKKQKHCSSQAMNRASKSENSKYETENQTPTRSTNNRAEDEKREEVEELVVRLAKTTQEP